MKSGYEQLRKQAMSLDVNARAELARDLLGSLKTLSETAIEQLWLEEAARRQEAAKRDPSLLVMEMKCSPRRTPSQPASEASTQISV